MSNTSLLRREVMRAACSELIVDSESREFFGTVTVTNISPQAVAGPIRVRLGGLGMGLRLVQPGGRQTQEPQVLTCLENGQLLPGGSVDVPIRVRASFWRLGLVRLTACASGAGYGLTHAARPVYDAA